MSVFLITASSQMGCVRKNNEDMILVNDKFLRDDEIESTIIDDNNSTTTIVAIADGMGGHYAGEVASSDTLHSLQYFANDLPKGMTIAEFTEIMMKWFDNINLTIDTKGRINPEMSLMGTTLVGFIHYDGKFFWMNCGDSRLYRLRGGELTQVSTDHSLRNAYGNNEPSNIIINCIGGGCQTSYLDICEFRDPVKEGDIYMLCSDGLNDMISDKDIEVELVTHGTANALIEAAYTAGGGDNVSVAVIKVEMI